MSGHSKWSTIKRQKGAKDAARGATFTKLGNAIAIAARSGTDPETNFALRLAVDKAKAANMPMANIQRSIDRVKDKSADQLQELTYEGYGPGGVAILVEAATDNLNRTYPEVRLAFTKHGGNMAEKGAVAFQFDRKGQIRVKGTGDDIDLAAIEAGADDVISEGQETVIYCPPNELSRVRDNLKDVGLEVVEAELSYIPTNAIEVTDKDTAGKIMRLMDALEDLDDVTNTYVNFDIDEQLLIKTMRIIGIDPGTGILGFGVIEVSDNRQLKLIDAGVIRTPAGEDDAIRLQTIYEELSNVIKTSKPEEMAVERLFFAKNVKTAMTVSQARGVVLLCGRLAELNIYEYTPLQIKQSLTGYGRAEKKQIQEMVKVILELKEIPKPDDCADALAAAITHAMMGRL